MAQIKVFGGWIFFTKMLSSYETKPLGSWKPSFINMSRNRNPKINVKSTIFCDDFIFAQSENCMLNTCQYIQNPIYFNFSQSMLIILKS